MVQNTKRYLVTEAQLYALKENSILDGNSEFTRGNYVELLEPVEGYIVPPNTIGTVLHVDAVGTVRTQFNVDGQEVVIPINPDVDRIVKAYNASGSLQENEELKKKVNIEMVKKYINQFNAPCQVGDDLFYFSVDKDEFIHFADRKIADLILKTGALSVEAGYSNFGVSIKYGLPQPQVQTTHIKSGDVVAIRFTTNVVPKYGYGEEVVWGQDVPLINPTIITVDDAFRALKSAENRTQLKVKKELVRNHLSYVEYI